MTPSELSNYLAGPAPQTMEVGLSSQAPTDVVLDNIQLTDQRVSDFKALISRKSTLTEQSNANVQAFTMLIENAQEAALVSPMAATYMRLIEKRLKELQLRLKIWISDTAIGSSVLEARDNDRSARRGLYTVACTAFQTMEVNLDDIRLNISTMRSEFLHWFVTNSTEE